MNRLDLLEMLVNQSRKIDEIQKRLSDAEKQLKNPDIGLKKIGSITEEAHALSKIFEKAEREGMLYVDTLNDVPGFVIFKQY
jgi:hypothetical protein